MRQPFIPNLVSVVIPCYNQGHYLATAIESVLSQQNVQVEVVIIDDGSTDNSRVVAQGFPQVKYLYQENQGLSAARNAGIYYCSGEFVVFLDADDWLVEGALSVNAGFLQQNKLLAFVSGAYMNFYESRNQFVPFQTSIETTHYIHLLERNYISMVAAVMFRRRVLEHYRFDVSLRTCEDYDLYLRIARKHPVLHHQEFIAVYRFHEKNISYRFKEMLIGALTALYKQKCFLNSKTEKIAWVRGVAFWKNFYAKQSLEILFKALIENSRQNNREEKILLWKYSKPMYLQYLKAKIWKWVKSFFK
ncbi:glycosyltransferase family 2 protein [Rufibacter soli]